MSVGFFHVCFDGKRNRLLIIKAASTEGPDDLEGFSSNDTNDFEKRKNFCNRQKLDRKAGFEKQAKTSLKENSEIPENKSPVLWLIDNKTLEET